MDQLHTMYAAVKEADPAAAVVLGGCGYDVFSSEPGSAPRQFFDYVAKAGRDAFDLFSVHLYGDPERIGEYLATARQFMQAHGYLKPVVAGEHAGPQPFEPEYPGPVDHLQLMHLMIGKLPLLGYRDGELAVRHPAAQTFALLAEKMAGARAVSRIRTDDRPGRYAFEVDRPGRGPLLVAWEHRDPFDGEDEPPADVTWPWPAATATITDVFGHSWTARRQHGRIRLPLSVTPLFVEPAGHS